MLVRAIERAGCVPATRWRSRSTSPRRSSAAAAATGSALERRELDRDGMIEMLLGWLDRYPIASIEDPLAEDDRDGWIAFTRAAGTRVQIIGDDYLMTNAARVAGGRGSRVQRRADQAQPGRHGHRSAGRARRRQGRGLRHDRLGALRRDRRHLDRASRGRLERRPAQGRLVRALASAWRNGTKCCASRKRWAARHALPGGGAAR